MRDKDYYRDAYFIVDCGLSCGLEHPIEWAANAWRTPGGTMSADYYVRMREVIPRFLVEMHKTMEMAEPATGAVIVAWTQAHWAENEMMQSFFKAWEPLLDSAIADIKMMSPIAEVLVADAIEKLADGEDYVLSVNGKEMLRVGAGTIRPGRRGDER